MTHSRVLKIDKNGQWSMCEATDEKKKDAKKTEKLSKPAPEGVSEEKYDSCVEQVKQEGDAKSAYAVCAASLKKSVLFKNNEQWSLQKMGTRSPTPIRSAVDRPVAKKDYNGNLKGGSENSEWTYKDDKAHPPGSPEDQAHDVIELDESLQAEMKDLSPEGKSDMLEHLRNYKKSPEKWKRSKKNIKAGDEKDEPGRD